MSTKSLDGIAPYRPRQFIPEEVDLTDPSRVRAVYEELLNRPMVTGEDVEAWLAHRSELEAAVDQAGTILYIAMTCQTDDAEKARRYKEFVQTVGPLLKDLTHQLNQRFVQAPGREGLDAGRYSVYQRAVETDLRLFVKENIDPQTKVELLSQEYQGLCGRMTVTFRGKEHTLPEMARFLQDPDRSTRQEAWRASARRRLQDKEKLDDIFNQMVRLRHQMARNAGFDDFTSYRFEALHRFDYTPEDCLAYHQAVEEEVLPIWKAIQRRRCQQMKLDRLRPWDLSADPLGRPALKPFSRVEELIQGCQTIFGRIDTELGEQFKRIAADGLLDLRSRPGKAPGGYQSTLHEARKPFIFMNAVGLDSDVRTLLHEGGHAFHALACAGEPLLDYRHAPIEFCEVASMSMELLADPHLTVFYSEQDAERSRLSHWEDVIAVLVWVATVDAFQHWIYAHPRHTPSERNAAWRQILDRFATGEVDWGGLEEERAYWWHRQLHIFEVPFYYIEYGIAQLGALGVWLNARKDPAAAMDAYRRALALGGSRPLPELFQAANIPFSFSKETMRPLMRAVEKELALFQK